MKIVFIKYTVIHGELAMFPFSETLASTSLKLALTVQLHIAT